MSQCDTEHSAVEPACGALHREETRNSSTQSNPAVDRSESEPVPSWNLEQYIFISPGKVICAKGSLEDGL